MEAREIFPEEFYLTYRPTEISLISTRGNNRVYSFVSGADRFVLKLYFRDERKRGEREYSFSQYLWSVGVTNIPRPLAFDTTSYAAVYSYVAGIPCVAGTISSEDIKSAISFVKDVNWRCSDASHLDRGYESCVSLREHVDLIDSRITKLEVLDSRDAGAEEVRSFICDHLRPRFNEMREVAHNGYSPLEPESFTLCLSPSDFGFHNCLRTDAGLYFLDFEYAGWDDPAKLICDFYNQPRVPADLATLPATFSAWATALDCEPEALRNRIRRLFPLYVIKWCCIMLNEFLPEGAARRAFSGGESSEERRIEQLRRSQAHSTLIEVASKIL